VHIRDLENRIGELSGARQPFEQSKTPPTRSMEV